MLNAYTDIEILKEVESLTELEGEIYRQILEAKERLEIAIFKYQEFGLGLERLQMLVNYQDLPNTFNEKTLF